MTSDDAINYQALAGEIAGWIRHHMDESGAARLVLGLSGGIDSAVVCALCSMATGADTVIAAILPIQSRSEDVRDAQSVARAFAVTPHLIDLAPAYEALVAALPSNGHGDMNEADQARRDHLALANIKPRLRMTALYALANRSNGLVVGTGNKTELGIGYFTKYGDGGVDLLPLGDIDKTGVRGLARVLGVPEAVIAKAPSAGLWEGQTDEDELGVAYDDLDRALAAFTRGEESSIDPGTRERVATLVQASEHKRRPVPVFRRNATDRARSR